MAKNNKPTAVEKETYAAFASLLSEQEDSLAVELNSAIRQVGEYSHLNQEETLELSRENLRLIVNCLKSDSALPYVDYLAMHVRERLRQGFFALDSLTQAVNALEMVVSNHVDSLIVARFCWDVFSQARKVLAKESESALQDYLSRQGVVATLELERTSQLVLFRSLVENTSDAIVMSDFHGRISFANRAAYTLLRGDYENQSLLGRDARDFWPENTWQQLDEISTMMVPAIPDEIVELSLRAREWRGELEQKRVDATLFEAAISMFAIYNDQGQFIELVSMIRDITEQRELEREIQRSLEQRGHQVRVSTQVAQEIAESEAIDVLFERVVTLIKENFGYYHAQILRYEPGLDAVVLVAGYGEIGQKMLGMGHQMPLGKGLIGLAAATGQTILRPNLLDDPDWQPNPLLSETQGEIALPIKLGEQILGVLDVQSNQAGALSAEDQLLLEGLCGQIAVAIEGTRLRQQMQERLAELNVLYQATSREGWKSIRQSARLPVGYLYDRLDVHGVLDPTEIDRVADSGKVETKLTVRGESIGILGVQADPQQPFDESEIQLIEQVSDQVAQALETSRLFQQTQQALSEAQILFDGSALINQAQSMDELLKVLSESTALGEMDQVVLEMFDRSWDEHPPELMVNAAIWDRTGAARESVGTTYHLADFPYLIEHLHQDEPMILADVLADERMDKNTLRVARDLGIRSMIFWPLASAGQWFGAIAAQSGEILQLSQDNIRLIESLVEQVANAIQSLRLRQDMQVRLNELNALQRMMSRDAWIAYQSRAYSETRGYLYNQVDIQEVTADSIGSFFSLSPGTQSVSETVTQTVPLEVRGEQIGALGIQPQETLSPEDEAFLVAISEQVAQAMERARLMEQTQKSAVELQAVAEVSTATSTILDPDQLLQSVVDLAKRNFGLYHAHIYLLDDTGENLTLAVGSGEVGRDMVSEGWSIGIEDEQSLVARVGRQKQGEYISDVRHQQDFLPNPLLPDTLSELAVPMVVGERLLGVFDVQSNVVNRFAIADVRTFSTLASQTSIALQNARLYAEQLATVERLRELDNMKSAFLANMSHELRTPLNSILGFTQVIQEGLDGDLTDLMVSDLELIEKNGKHLLNLINDVLDMAKIEAGRLNLSPEPINLYDLLEDVILSNSSLARDKSLDVRLDADIAGDWVVMADHVRLRQVLINLMSNSIKFTETGGVTFELERILPVNESEHERIQVRVRDTGIGIPPNKLEEIFEAFSQVDSSTTRKIGGTGLGLPISRRLIELHGGRLWAFSKGIPGDGSIFYLELPIGK